ncbi:SurA N-terminal domain-containing protein [Buchnera aphidicola]|uniref:SurA N-terminal domain-containing protein n=1 Tax=Buchnera aphidicola TaxID=9 RepID=UPI0001ECFE61|nr:SurA N-terminal domain-containing protein [Buchnera aphidicola]ADP67448.1 peptidyl-prolyl cis-trans isomerase D [Buchnera aphidicola str. JF99 (Acyrthosiphon pisum)]ADP67946.1 peptidyl-prolyl cis-trans isomerase D [Buchnera aphidicola str. JF98 (Acyrthosiphon pisum)]
MTKYSQARLNRIIVKFILGVIILSLILSTISIYINRDFEKYIATVNGEKISFNLFKKMYFIEREKQKKILGKNFFKFSHNENFTKETYNYVLSQLINNVLLEQYAKNMNYLEVNDNTIKKIIYNSPIFQKNNKFSKERYLNYLTSINSTNHEYINIIKKKINTENLIHTISKSNFILKKEEKNIIKLLSQKRIIKKAIVKIDPSIYKKNITNQEAQIYFKKNQDNFYIPEKFKINFVELKTDNFKIHCENKEIYDWYIRNITQYSTKEKRRYSIIQVKNKQQAISILSRLHNTPEDFSKIAQEQSTDPISSKKDGDIGWISIDLIPDEIKHANLNKKNQISDVIPFHNEFLIVKLNETQIGTQKKIYEVFDSIKKQIKQKKSLDLYNELKNKISNNLKNDPGKIERILKENNILIQETDWFDKKSIPKVLNIPILKQFIFNKKLFQKDTTVKPQFHFIVLKKNQSFLIKIKKFKNKEIQHFENVKKNIIKKLRFIKAIKETKKKSEEIIYDLTQGRKKLFKQSNLYFTDPEIISRYDLSAITSIVFSLPHPQKGKKIYTLYNDKNKNFIIISLEKVYNTNFSEKEKNVILEYLSRHNTEIIFNSILKDLREKSIIKYENIVNK